MKCLIVVAAFVLYLSGQPARAVRNPSFSLWPLNTPITYSIDSDLADGTVLSNRNHNSNIEKAIKIYKDNTCLDFQKVSSGAQLQYKLKDSGCTAEKGYKNRAQKVELGKSCDAVRKIWHETAHALGFDHEHARSDRDDFITVYTSSIQSAYQSDFTKLTSEETFSLPYDLGSAMHYGSDSFGVGGGRTIETNDAKYQRTIGSYQVSFLDIQMVNEAYCKGSCSGSGPSCQNGGYRDPKACTKCRCPKGFGGDTCDQVQQPTDPAVYYPPNVLGGKQYKSSLAGAGKRDSNCNAQTLTATDSLQTLQTSSGYPSMDTGAPLIPALECHWKIKAADPSKKVQLQLTQFGNGNKVLCATFCNTQYVEIKTGDNFVPSGFRFCCLNRSGEADSSYEREAVTSQTDSAIVSMYAEQGGLGFTLTYKQV